MTYFLFLDDSLICWQHGLLDHGWRSHWPVLDLLVGSSVLARSCPRLGLTAEGGEAVSNEKQVKKKC